MNKINDSFISYAASVLADTNKGLKGSEIIKECSKYAVNYGVSIPITSSDFGPFGSKVPNKRTALIENLSAFNGSQQFKIINDLCNLQQFKDDDEVKKLKEKLFQTCGEFNNEQYPIEACVITGWEKVNRTIQEMTNQLELAKNEEQFQEIGHLGRDALISIAHEISLSSKYQQPLEYSNCSPDDFKRILDAYLNCNSKCLNSNETSFIKDVWNLACKLTHDRKATKLDATLCLISVRTLMEIIKAIETTD